VLKSVVSNSTVLNCGAGVGMMAIVAAKQGAKSVLAFESKKPTASVAQENVKVCGVEEVVKVICGDSISHKGKVDVVISDLVDTILLEGNQVKVMNALISKKVITNTTTVIPKRCVNFFELVTYDYEFRDCFMPMIVKDSTANERCIEVLSRARPYNEINFDGTNVGFDGRIKPDVHYEGLHMVYRTGYINSLKFSTVVSFTDDILLGATRTFCTPIYVPVHQVYVQSGDVVRVIIDYKMGGGFESLKIDIR
jgi:FkbM family methyltransferase